MSGIDYMLSRGCTLVPLEELSVHMKFNNRNKNEFMLAWIERIGNYNYFYFIDKYPPFNMYVERHLIC